MDTHQSRKFTVTSCVNGGLPGPGGHTRAVAAAGVIVRLLGGGQCGQSHELLVRSAENLTCLRAGKPAEAGDPSVGSHVV